jgi:hypothetical protein
MEEERFGWVWVGVEGLKGSRLLERTRKNRRRKEEMKMWEHMEHKDKT